MCGSCMRLRRCNSDSRSRSKCVESTSRTPPPPPPTQMVNRRPYDSAWSRRSPSEPTHSVWKWEALGSSSLKKSGGGSSSEIGHCLPAIYAGDICIEGSVYAFNSGRRKLIRPIMYSLENVFPG